MDWINNPWCYLFLLFSTTITIFSSIKNYRWQTKKQEATLLINKLSTLIFFFFLIFILNAYSCNILKWATEAEAHLSSISIADTKLQPFLEPSLKIFFTMSSSLAHFGVWKPFHALLPPCPNDISYLSLGLTDHKSTHTTYFGRERWARRQRQELQN